MDRQLRQCQVEHLDVIRGRVRRRVSGLQLGGECFAGRIQTRDQGMEPEPAPIRRGRTLLLRMRGDERPVEVDHIEPRIRARRPCPSASRRPSDRDPIKHRVVNRFQRAPRGRNRRHLAEQARLIAQHRQVRDRLTAVRDHDRQIDQHLATVITPAPLLRCRHRHRQPVGQPELIGHIAQHPGARMRNHVPAITGHHQPRTTRVTLHLPSALLARQLHHRQAQSPAPGGRFR
jgi:hypothetical protein